MVRIPPDASLNSGNRLVGVRITNQRQHRETEKRDKGAGAQGGPWGWNTQATHVRQINGKKRGGRAKSERIRQPPAPLPHIFSATLDPPGDKRQYRKIK